MQEICETMTLSSGWQPGGGPAGLKGRRALKSGGKLIELELCFCIMTASWLSAGTNMEIIPVLAYWMLTLSHSQSSAYYLADFDGMLARGNLIYSPPHLL